MIGELEELNNLDPVYTVPDSHGHDIDFSRFANIVKPAAY